MTTTFTRQALIAATKDAIANMEGELADFDQRVMEYKAKHRERWLADNREQVKRVRDRLTKMLNRGGVIRREDVGDITRLLYSEPSSYDIGKEVGYLRNDYKKIFVRKLDAYRGVLKLLEAMDGETLSVNQLKTIGLTKLGDLFRVAANTGGLTDDNPLV